MKSGSEELVKIVEAYHNGSYRADGELLRSIFTDDCLSRGYIDGQFTAMPIKDYIQWITAVPSMDSQSIAFETVVESAEVWGDVASLTVRESNFFGTKNYLDNFQLMRIDGAWKIISKLFTTV